MLIVLTGEKATGKDNAMKVFSVFVEPVKTGYHAPEADAANQPERGTQPANDLDTLGITDDDIPF
jgi:hypothetical protein